jgi:hypothetical protein
MGQVPRWPPGGFLVGIQAEKEDLGCRSGQDRRCRQGKMGEGQGFR